MRLVWPTSLPTPLRGAGTLKLEARGPSVVQTLAEARGKPPHPLELIAPQALAGKDPETSSQHEREKEGTLQSLTSYRAEKRNAGGRAPPA